MNADLEILNSKLKFFRNKKSNRLFARKGSPSESAAGKWQNHFRQFRMNFAKSDGGRTWARTKDPLIKSQLLYQLSYASTPARLPRGGWGMAWWTHLGSNQGPAD